MVVWGLLTFSPLFLISSPLTEDEWVCAEAFDTTQQVNASSLTNITDAYRPSSHRGHGH